MAVGSHNILSKIDRALAAYLISVGAGTADDVYTAKRSLNKDLPNTVCHAQKWRYLTPNSGVYSVTAQVMVRTLAALDVDEEQTDVKDPSEERVSAAFDAFFAGVDSSSSALGDAITAAARATGDADLQDFTIQCCEATGGDGGIVRDEPVWTDAIDLEIVCCPADLS